MFSPQREVSKSRRIVFLLIVNNVGETRRKLSFFVMVLCYSRTMYVEHTVLQTMEHFLACHQNAFCWLGVPRKIMIDNLKPMFLNAFWVRRRSLIPNILILPITMVFVIMPRHPHAMASNSITAFLNGL